MSEIIEIDRLDHPGIAIFARLTDQQLRSRLDPEKAIIIAESPKVIRVALQSGYSPVALLAERRHFEPGGDAFELRAACDAAGATVYTGSRELLASLTGYTLTRGVLCALRRPFPLSVGKICSGARRIVVIDSVVDTTNIGAIFRSAAALGLDGALLTLSSCDPFNRRAVRVSMGTVFQLPWTWLEQPIESLHDYGFETVAMALHSRSISLDDERLRRAPRLAIVMGNEGDGLSDEVVEKADNVVTIPMARGVDSLNVAAASAVAFWALRIE